ncbi:flagellar brake protein [Tepidicella baoligensis]|uniref:flagellar brake protein n=1 Tax=Tepidicella baoligensis TaxID=2707016 RepID=UPI0015DB0C32|nr:flagellar brake protein [Tepidicella baoligensis]
MEARTDVNRLPGENSPYWIQYPLDIRQQFRLLCKHGERVRLWYGPSDSIVSVVLEVRDNGDLVFDVGPDARTNQRLLAAPNVLFTSMMDGVELKCALGPLREVMHEGLPAFASALPTRLHRLQRRDCHRMPIPVGHAVHGEIPSSPQAGPRPSDRSAQRIPIKLIDISLGGVAFELPSGTSHTWERGLRLPECRLQLDDMGVVSVDLEVRHIADIHTRSGTVRRKVGCRFTRLSAGAENLIQRYITRLELNRRNVG